NVIAAVLGVPPKDISESNDLERLGLDSLTSLEAHHALRSVLSVPPPESLFTSCKTVKDTCAAIAAPATPPAVCSGASTPRTSESSTLHEQDHDADVDCAATLAKVQGVHVIDAWCPGEEARY
ncbi:uncharacterized protein PHACADRAFT_211453, partial [Phanerochaete carnosa HHB-10118-sp]